MFTSRPGTVPSTEFASEHGRLAAATAVAVDDTEVSRTWTYDRRGLVVQQATTIDGVNDTVTLRYNEDGSLAGRERGACEEVTYTLDDAGRPTAITGVDESCAAIALATEIVYLPFGPVSSVLREGVEPGPPAVFRQMEYDLQYRTTSQWGAVGSTEVMDRTYVYDRSGNPTHVADSSSGVSRDYGYDDLQRLISSAGDESLSWDYDSVGNRLTEQREGGSTTTEYSYVSGTSRLDTVTVHEEGPPDESKVTHDAAGNVTSDDVSTFLYGPRGTLLRQPSAGTGFAYLYDADGRRVRTSREVNPATTVRHFLLPDGTPYLEDVPGGTQGDRSFVFLGGSLLAILDDSGVARHASVPDQTIPTMSQGECQGAVGLSLR